MGECGPGVVVLVRFPFADLSASKLRPALGVAGAGASDWVRRQITSNPNGDRLSVAIRRDSFATGGLMRDSFARPGKLFTANEGIGVRSVGQLSSEAHSAVVEAIVMLLRGEAQ